MSNQLHSRGSSTSQAAVSDPWTNRLQLVIVVAGIGVRLARFLEGRPLWLDESLVALNVLPNGPADFLKPLGHNTISPVGFLFGEWLITRVAGTGEHALRFLPLVASVVGMIVFARFARRALEPGAALLATALSALSPLLIYYAGETKSYAFDWLFVVLLMYATLSLAENPTKRGWLHWSLTAAFAALLSTAAPFIVGGCALALLTFPAMRRSLSTIVRIGIAAAPAALLFALQVFTTYHSSETRAMMGRDWALEFLQLRVPEGLVQAALLARHVVMEILVGDQVTNALPQKSMTLIIVAIAIGAIMLARRSLRVFVLVVAPVALAVSASVAHLWPLTPRLLLFVVPAVAITLASAIAAVTRLLPSRAGAITFSALSCLLVVGSAAGARAEWNKPQFVALPGALRHVASRIGPNATVYLSGDLVPACTYYLAWHPDRAALRDGNDSPITNCSFRGASTVAGNWPPVVRSRLDELPDMRPEWLEEEGPRIVAATNQELWVLISHSRKLREELPVWLERHGMRRVSERKERTIHVLQYVKGPS